MKTKHFCEQSCDIVVPETVEALRGRGRKIPEEAVTAGLREVTWPARRQWLRKAKIRARDSLSPEERAEKSAQIVQRILNSREFQNAKTVMLYRATRGEVCLDGIENSPQAQGKRLVYPRCVSKTEMVALLPRSEHSWEAGYAGIEEPVPEKSEFIAPEEIELVLCPCTVFDEGCNRMGFGAGFYDRFLERCPNAHIMAAAFEVQKTDMVPVEVWDKPMNAVFTEKATYRQTKSCYAE